ncbi:YerC/YecD family TrpR-related protein [Patescibacteria group bacterium]
MPRVSKKPISPKTEKLIYQDFCKTVSFLRDEEEIKDFLDDLLTHTEKRMLSKRFQIAVMLVEGLTYQKIIESLQVSDTTVSKVNNWLNTGANSLLKAAKTYLYETKEKYFKRVSPNRKYMAGDLATPLIDDVLGLAAKKIVERKRRR